MKAENGKWLYRLESENPENGLWYNDYGDYVFGIGEVDNLSSKDLPMGYDERYRQDGKNWFSSCTRKEDLTHWYSMGNAKDLIKLGFHFYKYLATEYVEYDKETVFVKDTALDRLEMPLEEAFNLGEP